MRCLATWLGGWAGCWRPGRHSAFRGKRAGAGAACLEQRVRGRCRPVAGLLPRRGPRSAYPLPMADTTVRPAPPAPRQVTTETSELDAGLIFEQDPVQIVDALLPLYMNASLLRSLQEALASELSARMNAMSNASGELTAAHGRMRPWAPGSMARRRSPALGCWAVAWPEAFTKGRLGLEQRQPTPCGCLAVQLWGGGPALCVGAQAVDVANGRALHAALPPRWAPLPWQRSADSPPPAPLLPPLLQTTPRSCAASSTCCTTASARPRSPPSSRRLWPAPTHKRPRPSSLGARLRRRRRQRGRYARATRRRPRLAAEGPIFPAGGGCGAGRCPGPRRPRPARRPRRAASLWQLCVSLSPSLRACFQSISPEKKFRVFLCRQH